MWAGQGNSMERMVVRIDSNADPVVAYVGERTLSKIVWAAVLKEYRRNGGRMVSPGKLRWLRRQARRGR